MNTKEAVAAAMRRAVEAAAQAKENPAVAALGEFPGHNRAGTASVWVDVAGRMTRLELAPGSVQEGDEEGIAAAIAEAYAEAVKAGAVFAREGYAEWARQHADLPAQRRRPEPDDDEDDSPLRREPL